MPQIRYPGSSLDFKTPNWSDTLSVLILMEGKLAAAAISLDQFVSCPAVSPPTREDRMSVTSEVRSVMMRLSPDGSAGNGTALELAALEARAEAEVAGERWRRGLIPRSFVRQVPFVAARGFLFAADEFQKALKVLHETCPGRDLEGVIAQLAAQVPDLTGVRDTAHHEEDRIRLLGRRGVKITPERVEDSTAELAKVINVHGPGEVRISAVDTLVGDRYTATLQDGRLAEVRVNRDTLMALQAALQAAVAAFEWMGPPHWWPDPT